MKGPNKQKPTIAIITPFPAPYRIPFFNALDKIPEIDLTILITEMKGVPNQEWSDNVRDWNFRYIILPSIVIPYQAPQFGPAYYPINYTLPIELMRQRYDVIITLGWTSLFSNISLFMKRILSSRIVLWETSIPNPASRLKQRLEPFIRLLISSYDAWLAISTLCCEYLKSYGANPDRIFLMPQVIDFDYYNKSAHKLANYKSELRRTYNVYNRKVICFVGQLIERKGINLLIETVYKLIDSIPELLLLIVGKGPYEDNLKQHCKKLGLNNKHIRFLGFIPQSKLPEIYSVSDVFVLPSYYDTFGAVVLEAMASGLPVVVTECVGASSNVVFNGINGLVVPKGSVKGLRDAISKILGDVKVQNKMIKASESILRNLNTDNTVNIFRNLLLSIL